MEGRAYSPALTVFFYQIRLHEDSLEFIKNGLFGKIFVIFVYNALKTPKKWPSDVSALDALNDYTWHRHLAEKTSF